MARKPRIGIIGLGMVGTPLKRYFEEVLHFKRGRELFLFDKDAQKGFRDDINRAEIVFIAVPTPRKKGDGTDTSIVEAVVRTLISPKVVVIKSTVPPGTVARLQRVYPKFVFLFNPEFLTEKNSWKEFIKPDRQIVAAVPSSHTFAKRVLALLPKAPVSSPVKNLLHTTTEAELGKYAANLFGAMKVAFGNVIKDFCDALEKEGTGRTSYKHVRVVVAGDQRIGGAWLDVDHGGYRGYGGYCFTKDTAALIHRGEELLRSLGRGSAEYKRLHTGLKFLRAMREYNKILLRTQGLSEEDVSVHDHEWVVRKLKNKNNRRHG